MGTESGATGAIVTPVRFEVSAPDDGKLSGLKLTESLLQNIKDLMVAINATAAGRGVPSVFKTADLKKKILDLRALEKNTAAEFIDLFTKSAKSAGGPLGDALTKEVVTRLKAGLATVGGGVLKNGSFRTAQSAAKYINSGLATAAPAGGGLPGLLEQLARVSSRVPVVPAGGKATAELAGDLRLDVPVNRIKAFLEPGDSKIQLIVPANRVAGTASGEGDGAAKDKKKKNSGDGSTKEKPPTGFEQKAYYPEPDANELQRRVTRTKKAVSTSITKQIDSLTKTVETTTGEGDITKQVLQQSRLAQFRKRISGAARQEAEAALQGFNPTGDKAGDLRARAGLNQKLASELRKLATDEEKNAAAIGEQAALAQLNLAAARLDKSARQDLVKADQAAAAERKKALDSVFKRVEAQRKQDQADATAAESLRKSSNTSQQGYRKSVQTSEAARDKERAAEEKRQRALLNLKAGDAGVLATEAQARARIAELEAQGYALAGTRGSKGFKRTGGAAGTETLTYAKDDGGRRLTESFKFASQGGKVVAASMEQASRALKATNAEAGALAQNFITNTAKVAAWTASVGLLYGTLNLARQGMASFIETSYQMQRLDVVFSGLGGDTRALTSDLFALAAANGRAGKEALDSGIQWSRLGLTRRQVNEAVRQSLIGANAAEVDAVESTKNLQAIMAGWQLQVGGLAGVMGELNAVSNSTKVTVNDLFTGLSKVGSVARSAGLSLSETIGFIGAGVATTGQSGAAIATGLKSYIGSFANPEIQKSLAGNFGVDVRNESGELKSLSDILAELYSAYQRLGQAEQQHLVFQVAGKTQSSRLQAALDSYVKAQVLAINAQLNLNSAEAENAKITGTLRAELQSLTTELAKFAAEQGANGPGAALGSMVRSLRNVVSLLNTAALSPVVTGFTALMAVLAARALMTKVAMDKLSASPGFLARSYTGVTGALAHLSRELTQVSRDFQKAAASGGAFVQAVGRVPRFADVNLRLMGRAAGRMGGVTGLVGRGAAGAGRLALGGLAAGALALPEIVGLYAAYQVAAKGVEVVLQGMGRSSAAADKALAKLNSQMQASKSAAGAAALAVKLFDTAAKSLAGFRSENEKRNLVGQLGDLQGGLAVDAATQAKLLQAKTSQEAQQLLAPFRQKASDLELEKSRRAISEQIALARRLGEEVKRLESKPKSSRDENLLDEKRAALSEAQGEAARLVVEESDALVESTKAATGWEEKRLLLLEKHRVVLESIAQIEEGLSAGDPASRLGARLAALDAEASVLTARGDMLRQQKGDQESADTAAREQELEQLQAERDAAAAKLKRYGPLLGRFQESGDLAPETRRAIDMLGTEPADAVAARLQQVAEMDRRIAAARNAPGAESVGLDEQLKLNREQQEENRRKREAEGTAAAALLADVGTVRQRGAAEARSDAERFKYGDNETEKLANQARGLDELNAAYRERYLLATDYLEKERIIGQLFENRQQAAQVLLEQQGRGNQLESQKKQLLIDQRREFEKATLMAGPGELLKRLAALQATGNGTKKLSAGQFFALGDLRQYVTAQPGYGPEAAGLAQEGRQRAGLGLTPEAFRAGQDKLDDQQSRLRRDAVNLMESMAPQLAGALDRTAGQVFNVLGQHVSGFVDGPLLRLTNSFDTLAARVDSLFLGGGSDLSVPQNKFSGVPSL